MLDAIVCHSKAGEYPAIIRGAEAYHGVFLVSLQDGGAHAHKLTAFTLTVV